MHKILAIYIDGIQNWKEPQTVYFNKNINLIKGRNDAGKTALHTALSIFSGTINNDDLRDDFMTYGREQSEVKLYLSNRTILQASMSCVIKGKKKSQFKLIFNLYNWQEDIILKTWFGFDKEILAYLSLLSTDDTSLNFIKANKRIFIDTTPRDNTEILSCLTTLPKVDIKREFLVKKKERISQIYNHTKIQLDYVKGEISETPLKDTTELEETRKNLNNNFSVYKQLDFLSSILSTLNSINQLSYTANILSTLSTLNTLDKLYHKISYKNTLSKIYSLNSLTNILANIDYLNKLDKVRIQLNGITDLAKKASSLNPLSTTLNNLSNYQYLSHKLYQYDKYHSNLSDLTRYLDNINNIHNVVKVMQILQHQETRKLLWDNIKYQHNTLNSFVNLETILHNIINLRDLLYTLENLNNLTSTYTNFDLLTMTVSNMNSLINHTNSYTKVLAEINNLKLQAQVCPTCQRAF